MIALICVDSLHKELLLDKADGGKGRRGEEMERRAKRSGKGEDAPLLRHFLTFKFVVAV